jgi:hypothetical protein
MKKRPPKNWKDLFIQALAETGVVTTAARAAKVSRSFAYAAKESDRGFDERWEEALEDACDLLELECRRRGVEGCDRPVFHQGVQCGIIKEYSDRCLLAYLAAHRPERWNPSYDLRRLVSEIQRSQAAQSPATGAPDDPPDELKPKRA